MTYTAVFTPVAKFTAGYYIVGNMNNWYPDPAYKLTLNNGAAGTEYMLSRLSLTTASQFKVVYAEPNPDTLGSTWTWFPGDGGSNYGEHGEITASGKYTVYFRPNYDGDGWFYGCIFLQGDASASIQFLGAGLQRRVRGGTTDVIDYQTNIRFGFTFQLPYGAEIDTNASYFRWKLGGQATATDGNKIDIKNLDNSGSDPVAHMIITAVPKEYYTANITCFAHLAYTLNNTAYVLESDGNGAYVRSVSYVCEGLIAAASTPQHWKDYAQLLLDALN